MAAVEPHDLINAHNSLPVEMHLWILRSFKLKQLEGTNTTSASVKAAFSGESLFNNLLYTNFCLMASAGAKI